MRKYSFLILGLLITLGISAQRADSLYYYYKGTKHYLQLDTTRLFVAHAERQISEGTSPWRTIEFGTEDLKKGYKAKTQEMSSSEKIFLSLLNREGNIVGLSDYLYVKVKQPADSLLLQEQARAHSLRIVRASLLRPGWYLLERTGQTEGTSLEVANRLYESRLFAAAEPDFIQDCRLAFTPAGPYYKDQWNLNNTGQYSDFPYLDIEAAKAWQISTGKGITVAVIDQGVQLDHPDLKENIHPLSYDTYQKTSPSIIWGEHGTCCAGIIGAVNNSIGTVGIAPDCKIMSISHPLLFFPSVNLDLAEGIEWAWQNKADVISCSWRLLAPSEIIDEAIENAVTRGRNGKGTLVVFATANDNLDTVAYPGCSPNTLAVGAMSPCGERKSPTSCDTETEWGSNYGDQIDVVAPGVLIPTTDQTGKEGYNPAYTAHPLLGGTKLTTDYDNLDYTVWFCGTSSACPHVAGIAALVLAAHPELTQQELRSIIQRSCMKLPGYSFTHNDAHPDGTWNREVGYGGVNAYAALLAAANATSSASSADPEPEPGALRSPFSLYPNPASGFVRLQWKENFSSAASPRLQTAGYQVQIWSSRGLVRTLQAKEPEAQIPLDGLQPGLYFVHVLKDGRTYKQKLQVQ